MTNKLENSDSVTRFGCCAEGVRFALAGNVRRVAFASDPAVIFYVMDESVFTMESC